MQIGKMGEHEALPRRDAWFIGLTGRIRKTGQERFARDSGGRQLHDSVCRKYILPISRARNSPRRLR